MPHITPDTIILEMSVGRKTGKVKFFNSQKGYGFIIPDEEAGKTDDIFVHHTAIHNDGGFKSLAEGEEVEYDMVQGPKGMQASNVSGPGGISVRGDPNAGRRQYDQFGGQRFGGMVGLGAYGLNQTGYAPGAFALGGQPGYPYGSPNFSSAQVGFGQYTQPAGFGGNFSGQQSYLTGTPTSSSHYAPQAGGNPAYSQFSQFPQGAGVSGSNGAFAGGNGGFGFGAAHH